MQILILFAGEFSIRHDEETYPDGIENAADRGFTYLDGGTLCVTDAATGQKQFYYMLTDNLGSIDYVVTGDGSPYFSAIYDAWGRQTFVDDFLGFHRGYCGHEMIPDYGLIHMRSTSGRLLPKGRKNGRLYDPMLGRFLSPDNYVQQPDNSQNFNHYSYCLNNPLKYTDPSGEAFGIDDIIATVAMAYIGGVIANIDHSANTGNNPNWGWSAAAGFIEGALIGYQMANESGKNLWWGNSIKYNKSPI